jgi:hypothetical protein
MLRRFWMERSAGRVCGCILGESERKGEGEWVDKEADKETARERCRVSIA